ncbi:NADH-quinone oxidoreductase subunit J [bacterium]|nr:NADH-quinone oxidoreductase subunit J [bacterium]MBU1752361.1 NADH-quinone oxidoreductase subunit J [bacterium]
MNIDAMCSLLLSNMAFFVLAAIGIICGVLVVTVKNLIHAVLFLAVFLLSVAGLFITLNAEFLAIIQVFIFVGAIVVLFMFLIMLTYKVSDMAVPQGNRLKGVALVVSSVLFCLIFYILKAMKWNEVTPVPITDDVSKIGRLLLGQYVLPFELVSFVLLAALIGAIVIARKGE